MRRLVSILISLVPFLFATLTGCSAATALIRRVALVYLDTAARDHPSTRWWLVTILSSLLSRLILRHEVIGSSTMLTQGRLRLVIIIVILTLRFHSFHATK
jgi:hypothetical protein